MSSSAKLPSKILCRFPVSCIHDTWLLNTRNIVKKKSATFLALFISERAYTGRAFIV
jgi:hypothetical protein